MNWIQLDINNLPTEKVLAANFDNTHFNYKHKFLGTLEVVETSLRFLIDGTSDKKVVCHCGPGEYYLVTHFVDINSNDF